MRRRAAYIQLGDSMILPPASLVEIANIADEQLRLEMMRGCVVALQNAGDLYFPLLNLIAVFIDGLVAAPQGRNRSEYPRYLEKHFPDLCAALPAASFYEHYRCKAVHEFGLGAGYAIGRDSGLRGAYIATQPVKETGQALTVLNIDRLASDFLRHVESLIKSP
jgi:hypothetical protein